MIEVQRLNIKAGVRHIYVDADDKLTRNNKFVWLTDFEHTPKTFIECRSKQAAVIALLLINDARAKGDTQIDISNKL